MTTIEIPSAMRQMIDARLDSVERALMAKGMGRSDRQQILGAIEDQILEMLSQSSDEEPTRDDVLLILAKLDPPEAYMDFSEGDGVVFPVSKTGERPRATEGASMPTTKKDFNVLAIISFVLTCFAFLGSFTWWMLAYVGLIPLSMVTIAAGICGTIALYQFILDRHRYRGLWMALTACTSAPVLGFLAWASLIIMEMR